MCVFKSNKWSGMLLCAVIRISICVRVIKVTKGTKWFCVISNFRFGGGGLSFRGTEEIRLCNFQME